MSLPQQRAAADFKNAAAVVLRGDFSPSGLLRSEWKEKSCSLTAVTRTYIFYFFFKKFLCFSASWKIIPVHKQPFDSHLLLIQVVHAPIVTDTG